MKCFKVLLIFCMFSLFLSGCFHQEGDRSYVNVIPPTTFQIPEETKLSDPEPPADEASGIPTYEEVLAARELALEDMTQEQIDRLKQVVKKANYRLEYVYIYRNHFKTFEDSDSLSWNYFEQTGEIQIGWAYSSSLDKEEICELENLTEQEFYDKYGKGVCTTNHYDADAFIALLEELCADVQNVELKADLQYLMEETRLAKETHDVEHLNNIYKKLHDLDYFLLRYGPGDVGPYVRDSSTVTKYYGTLSFYES